MNDETTAGSPLATADLVPLIGILARLTGLLMTDQLDAQDDAHFVQRAIRDGLLPEGASKNDLIEALEGLIARVRLALGEGPGDRHASGRGSRA